MKALLGSKLLATSEGEKGCVTSTRRARPSIKYVIVAKCGQSPAGRETTDDHT